MNATTQAGKGVRKVDDHYVAVWQYARRQVKREFYVPTYGKNAGAVAHMARDIGILVEADRKAGQ